MVVVEVAVAVVGVVVVIGVLAGEVGTLVESGLAVLLVVVDVVVVGLRGEKDGRGAWRERRGPIVAVLGD